MAERVIPIEFNNDHNTLVGKLVLTDEVSDRELMNCTFSYYVKIDDGKMTVMSVSLVPNQVFRSLEPVVKQVAAKCAICTRNIGANETQFKCCPKHTSGPEVVCLECNRGAEHGVG